jgi:hypothetical protein
MSQAPNESKEQYERKNELFKIRDSRELTIYELYELQNLTRNAISHLQFSTIEKV